MKLKMWAPLAVFCLFIGALFYQMQQPKDDSVKSAAIGERIEKFSLPAIATGVEGASDADFTDGKPKLLNIWASWCVPCVAEAPQLMQLKEAGVPIIGIVNHDTQEKVDAFLKAHGNPYTKIGSDELSAVMLSIGAQGIPETFIVDGDGIVTYQHIGDIRAENVPEIMQKWREAGGE